MILICPDSFKDAISSLEACKAMARGIESSLPELSYKLFPVSDGGEGFTEVLDYHLNLKRIPCTTTDPLNRPIETEFLFDEIHERAFFAMSQAAGLELLGADERDPLHTTTHGVGVMVKACVDSGAKEIMIGVGGSATNDGGVGMASALGWQFLDRNGILPSPTGKNLSSISEIIRPTQNILQGVKIHLLCDVENPLLGPSGATYTYGAQKGATAAGLRLLEEGMDNLNALFQLQLDKYISNIPGSGAAGGFGAGALVFMDGSLESGIQSIIELVDFNKHLKSAALVLTGEGKLDAQTASGKLIHGIASLCREQNVPVVAFCGQVKADSNEIHALGLNRAISISEGIQDLEVAMSSTSALLEKWVHKDLPVIIEDLSLKH